MNEDIVLILPSSSNFICSIFQVLATSGHLLVDEFAALNAVSPNLRNFFGFYYILFVTFFGRYFFHNSS